MTTISRRSPNAHVALVLVALAACGWTSASVRAEDAPIDLAAIAKDDSLFIDGRTFQVIPGRAKDDAAARISQIKRLGARELGPAAIVFRSGDKLYVAGVPVRVQDGAVPGRDVYVTAKENPVGHIRTEYVPPANPEHQKIYEMVKERGTLEMVQQIFSPFRIPVDLVIKTVGCDGVSNAWYERKGKQPTVSVCYEYLHEIWQSMPTEMSWPMGLTMADSICGQLFFAIAHELGHAMFDIFDVPVFGRQEDAADQFATFIILQFGGDRAYRSIAGAAYGYHEYIKDLKDKPKVTLPLAAFSSDHGTPEERYFNLVCSAYGYDANLFAPVMDKLPPARAKKCKFEYDDLKFAFHEVFDPHLDLDVVKKVLATDWFTEPQQASGK